MRKQTLWICCILLAACVGVSKWHHNIDRQSYELQLDSDIYLMNVLAEKIEERDDYIRHLEGIIITLDIETDQ